jgi:hypothetical protein
MSHKPLHIAPPACRGGRGVGAGGLEAGIAPAVFVGIGIALRPGNRRSAAFQSS